MQRYFVNKKDNNQFELSQEDTHHIKTVMRMKLEDLIEVVFNEKVYLTKIKKLQPLVVASIIEEYLAYNELDVKVTICQSLVKENKMDLILQKGVELGATSFIPLQTKNSIIKGTKKDFEKKVSRWQEIVKNASRQAKRNIVPKVFDVLTVKELGEIKYDLKILCTVNEMTRNLKNILQNNTKCDTMIIVVGPEGGFTRDEEEYLIQKGFLSTSLSKFVLRTETAALCALSMINYEYER